MKRLLQGLGKYRRLLLVAVAVFAADQASKFWMLKNIPAGAYRGDEQSLTLIDGWLYFVHIYNPGAAWGMFSGWAMALGLLGIAAIALMFVFRRQLELHRRPVQLIFGLLIGGILGNLVDRFAYGHVLDFILVILPGGYEWPAFNVADIAITSSVAAYFIASIVQSLRKRGDEKPA